MANTRKTLFISDLHLEENRPETTQQFLQLLKSCETDVDALYILGDLFEAWVGDDEVTPLHDTVIKALKAATDKGLHIYVLHGNRDFLIGKKFLRATGCKLLSEETKILLYHTPVLLMHGDTLCTRDVAYLKARRIVRNRFLLSIFMLLPLSWRKNTGDKMRAKSKRHTQSAAMEIMDVTEEKVHEVMQKHQVAYLIHGHTHRPCIHKFLLNHTPASRIVLGAWHDRGSVVIWDESGKKELVTL